MDKKLLLNVALPLSALAIVSIVLHIILGWDGFFLNLSTELIGIIVTVGFVDYVIKKRETEMRVPADQRVKQRILELSNAWITIIRTALGINAHVFDFSCFDPNDIESFEREMIRVSIEFVEPAIEGAKDFNAAQWSALVSSMRLMHDKTEQALQLLGDRTRHELFANAIDLQTAAETVISLYQTFPDLLGVPDNQLAPLRTGESAVPLKRRMTKQAVEHLRTLSTEARKLISLALTLPS